MIKMVSLIHISSGITLFSRIFDKFCENINSESETQLIGCFISAIKKFSQELGQKGIKQIEMSNLKVLIHEHDPIIIFILIDNSDDSEDYSKTLIMCCNAFFQVYRKEINENYNKTSIFQKFNPILQEILKIPPDKIEPSCINCPMGQKKDCLFNRVKQQILEFNKN